MKKTVTLAALTALACICTSCSDNSGGISESRAKEIALSNANLSADQVTFVEARTEHDDGRKIYDIEFYSDDFTEYDYEIDAATGDIISSDSDAEGFAPSSRATPEDNDKITEDEAKSIVLQKVPGTSKEDITEFKLESDDGTQKYEGKIYYNGTEYEFEIDANSGSIITWETE